RTDCSTTTPSAPLLWLRDIFLMAQPPLLTRRGILSIQHSYLLRGAGWSRGRNSVVFCAHFERHIDDLGKVPRRAAGGLGDLFAAAETVGDDQCVFGWCLHTARKNTPRAL